MCCVVCNCVWVGYTAEPPNVIGHIQQTLLEWGLLSPPNDITALSHLFSSHVHGLKSARTRLQVRGVFTTALLLLTVQQRLSGEAELGQTTVSVCVSWGCKSGRVFPSRLLGGEKNSTLAKQDLRTEKVWSFISHQIQIRILIQPLNPVYPFNPRLGVCIRMWAREKGGEGLQIQPRTG